MDRPSGPKKVVVVERCGRCREVAVSGGSTVVIGLRLDFRTDPGRMCQVVFTIYYQAVVKAGITRMPICCWSWPAIRCSVEERRSRECAEGGQYDTWSWSKGFRSTVLASKIQFTLGENEWHSNFPLPFPLLAALPFDYMSGTQAQSSIISLASW